MQHVQTLQTHKHTQQPWQSLTLQSSRLIYRFIALSKNRNAAHSPLCLLLFMFRLDWMDVWWSLQGDRMVTALQMRNLDYSSADMWGQIWLFMQLTSGSVCHSHSWNDEYDSVDSGFHHQGGFFFFYYLFCFHVNIHVNIQFWCNFN